MTYPPGPDDRPDPSRYPGHQPPPPGHGPPPQWGPPPFSAGAAIGHGWTVLTGRVGTWVGLGLVWGLILLVVSGIAQGLFARSYYTTGADGFGDLFLQGLSVGVVVSDTLTNLALFIASVGFARVALDVTDRWHTGVGRGFTFGDRRVLLGVGVTYALAGAVASMLFLLPSLVLAWLMMFLAVAVADGAPTLQQAYAKAWALVSRNLGVTLVLFLLQIGVGILGVLACGVGLLAAIPVIVGSTAYAYRVLDGRPVPG